MTLANLVQFTSSQGRARQDQKFHRELGEGVLNLLADARTSEIVGKKSPSHAQTALVAGMKGSAIMWNTLNPRGQSSPQRLLDPGIRETDGQRAAVLDCYEEVAPESIEMSAHLKPRRCSGVPAFEADRRNNLKPNINEAMAESDLLTLAEVAARLWCSKAHVCHAIRGQVKGVTLLPAISFWPAEAGAQGISRIVAFRK